MATVLLIEDDETQRFVAAFALKKAGHTVHEAVNGEEGLARAIELKPDLVICDVMMPIMNGYQVVSAMRATAETAAIPVIMLTAMSERSQVRLGMTSGADDYLAKPYRPQELIDSAQAVLARRSAHQEAVLSTLHEKFAAALEQQHQSLASRYEHQLAQEVNARWEKETGESPQVSYEGATLLLADLFRALPPGREEVSAADMARRAFQAARDTIYLFGAAQVLPYGDQMLAVFSADRDSFALSAAGRATRAAFALQAAMATTVAGAGEKPELTVALHTGNVTLIRLTDALHGDAGLALLPGPAVRMLEALRQTATERRWRVAGSATTLAGVPAEVASRGASAFFNDLPIAELFPPSA